MLISVKSPAEAAIVAAADGVTVVDVKDPARGSLGFAGTAVTNEIARQISAAKPSLSVALGELQELDVEAVRQIQWAHVDFVKVGLSGLYQGARWQSELLSVLANVPAAVRRVLVLYVDQIDASRAHRMIQDAHEVGLSVVLLDTFDKARGNTFAHWSATAVEDVFQSASRSGLTTVLAGSIGLADFPKALRTGADLIGVRGAVCDGDRSGALSRQRLENLISAYHEFKT